MIIGNAKLFLDGAFQEGSLTFENGVITAVGPAQGPCDLDAGGKYLVPGFLDVHTHGAMNEDFSDGRPEGLPIMSRHYAAHGVTSFLATTMTLKEETLTPAMHAIRDFRRPADGAKCAGIHLEGPFLCYAKRGAQAAENLHDAAAARNVTVSVTGQPAVLPGVRRLIYEIVYNLCDNAIKYNRDGGRVDVTVAADAGGSSITVADTGIGIAPEHQARVFERFYRVDKSHSKASGGTGLGLSIVKHAVQYHHGRIELESTPGTGTTIRVVFPNP